MKIIVFVLALLAIAHAEVSLGDPIWKSEFENFEGKWEKWQSQDDTSVPKVVEEDDESVLYFDGEPTHYSGYVSKETIKSDEAHYWITFWFKGTADKRTGGYFGYTRETKANVQYTLALDQDLVLEQTQMIILKNDGDWKQYMVKLDLEEGEGFQIILEKGNYLMRPEENFDAKFKDIKVYDFWLCAGDCPAETEEIKLYQLFYYTETFFSIGLENKAFAKVNIDNAKTTGEFSLEFFNPLCCIKSALYMLDINGDVVEDFNPTMQSTKHVELWEKSFTMSDVEKWGCAEEEKQIPDGTSTLYTCDLEMHLYYDYAKTYSTKQAEFDYSSKNSQGIFKSKIYITINKQDKTIFNSFIQTLVKNNPCGSDCELTLELTLELFYKINNEANYQSATPTETEGQERTLVWGDYAYFKIVSDPEDYNLDLLKVIITTEANTPVTMGDFFIANFIKNKKTDTKGELTFEMLISGESGLDKGKKFFLAFLSSSEASRRLLETESTTKAALSSDVEFTTGLSAFKLSMSLLALILLAILF